MKSSIKFFIALVCLFASLGSVRVYGQSDNFITQYDPYIITLKKFNFYYPESDPVNAASNMVIVVQGNIGNYKNAFIKFIPGDKIGYDLAREYEDGFLQEVTVLDRKGVLVPPVKDISGNNFLELVITGYADLTPTDYEKIKALSSAEVLPVSTAMVNPFNGIYTNFMQKADVLKPTDEKWAEAEAFLAGMKTRIKSDLGSVTYNVPMVSDVRNISSGANLVAGDKSISMEDKKNPTIGIVNFRQLKDEEIVSNMDYYKKLYDFFNKYGGTSSFFKDNLPGIMQELNDFKAQGFKDKNDVYINPEAKKQLSYLLEILAASVPIKADTVETTTSQIPLETQVALDYFKENFGSDRTRFNKYIYETYIVNDINRAKVNRDIDLIRKYYNYR
jgi:hypothetical protein